jgi:hypothetical protein
MTVVIFPKERTMPRLRDLPDEELLEQWLHWDLKAKSTLGWVRETATRFRDETAAEIDRRKEKSDA